jgi:hypothetical protein
MDKVLLIDTPPIDIDRLDDRDDFRISVDLIDDDFVGVLQIRLDPESMEWDTHDGEDVFPRSCNRLRVSVSTDLDVSPAHFLENAYFSVIEYLVLFFNYLQIELGQYWVDVGPIPDWDLLTFLDKTTAKRTAGQREEKIRLPIGGFKKEIRFAPKRRVYPERSRGLDATQVDQIETWLEQHTVAELANILMTNSKRWLLHGDYRSSSVLAITALEGPLEAFVKERCRLQGVPRQRDSVASDLGQLPSILGTGEFSSWLEKWLESSLDWHVGSFADSHVMDWAIALNRARNKAVHEGISPDFDTLDKGIFAAEAICEFAKAHTGSHP